MNDPMGQDSWEDIYGCEEARGVATTFSKDAVLNTTPHYTDERFRHAQTVFGAGADGLTYSYSDRLWEWDYERAEAAVESANSGGARPKTARWYEDFISAYVGRSVVVVHILAGWNWSTGFPYFVLGYKASAAEEEA